VTAVKDAKSDSSFFSAPKPKPRLPSFKKAPIAPPASTVKKEVDPKVAQPSSIDPFQEVLKSLGKAVRKESPATSTPPPIPVANSVPQAATGLTKSGKKKKTVSWAPEGQLEMIKYIEKAVYDDDGIHVSSFRPLFEVLQFLSTWSIQGPHLLHSLRDLDRGEGAALHAHLFEEAIDWYEPIRKRNS
jgi:protein phosphatase 1 regulatory subunit 10